MALLHHQALADYQAQSSKFFPERKKDDADAGLAALEEFLTTFKTSSAASEAAATHALEGLNIEDGLSDEYDFMEDADEAAEGPARVRRKDTKKKYMDVLQKVANRELDEIQIDLDDLDTVGIMHSFLGPRLTNRSSKGAWTMTRYD